MSPLSFLRRRPPVAPRWSGSTNMFGEPTAVCPVNGPDCDLCGPGHEFPAGDHWTDEMARANLSGWRNNYTPEQIERWLAANADRPGAA